METLWGRAFGGFFPQHDSYYEEDSYVAALPADDGGVIVAANARLYSGRWGSAVSNYDIVILEVLRSGELAWKVVYEEDPAVPTSHQTRGMIKTQDGGLVLVGDGPLVMKLGQKPHLPYGKENRGHNRNPDVSIQWVKSLTYGSASGVAEMPDGGIIVGVTRGNGLWLIKFDPRGEILWKKGWGEDWYTGCILQATADGGFIVTGIEDTPRNGMLLKFDGEGELQWQRTYAGQQTDPKLSCEGLETTISSISPTHDGGWIMAGNSYCRVHGHHQYMTSWLCKLTPAGLVSWSRGYFYFPGLQAIESEDGGYLAVSNDHVLKLGPSGEIQWLRASAHLGFATVFQNPDKSCVLVGYYRPDSQQALLSVAFFERLTGSEHACLLEYTGDGFETSPGIYVTSGVALSPHDAPILVQPLNWRLAVRPCPVTDICSGQSLEESFQYGEDDMVKRSRQIIWGLLVVPLVAGLGLIELRAVNRVNFPIADSPAPHIDNVYCQCNHYGLPCTELGIYGTGFGASRVYVSGGIQMAQVVIIDGKPLVDPNKYYGWSDTYIGCSLEGFVPIVVDQLYQVAIGHMPLLATNVNLAIDTPAFPFRYLIRWAPDYPPQSGAPGHVALEIACGIMPPQGSLVLMMGSTQVAKIINWGSPDVGKVRFRVPNLPPGKYQLWIKKGTKSVSNKKDFTVNSPA